MYHLQSVYFLDVHLCSKAKRGTLSIFVNNIYLKNDLLSFVGLAFLKSNTRYNGQKFQNFKTELSFLGQKNT